MDKHVPPIVFAIEIIHFQPLRDRQPPISGQRTENVPPKDKYSVAIQNSLQERTEIEASGGKCDSYSAAPRLYIRSFLLSIFIHLVCLHEVADSASYRPHPSL